MNPIVDPPPFSRPATTSAASSGWECPRCHATYAPWVAECTHCRPAPASLRERIATGASRPVPLSQGGLPDVYVV